MLRALVIVVVVSGIAHAAPPAPSLRGDLQQETIEWSGGALGFALVGWFARASDNEKWRATGSVSYAASIASTGVAAASAVAWIRAESLSSEDAYARGRRMQVGGYIVSALGVGALAAGFAIADKHDDYRPGLPLLGTGFGVLCAGLQVARIGRRYTEVSRSTFVVPSGAGLGIAGVF